MEYLCQVLNEFDEISNIAYLAGMVDADGSIYMRIQRKSLSLKVLVYNTDETLMQWLKLTFDGNYRSYKYGKHETWKELFVWEASHNVASALLKRLLPYLIVKKARAALGIKAWDTRGGGKGHPVSDEDLAVREQSVLDMHELNKTGKLRFQ